MEKEDPKQCQFCWCISASQTLQYTATRCTLQHTATHCNTLQHTATHLVVDVDFADIHPADKRCRRKIKCDYIHHMHACVARMLGCRALVQMNKALLTNLWTTRGLCRLFGRYIGNTSLKSRHIGLFCQLVGHLQTPRSIHSHQISAPV